MGWLQSNGQFEVAQDIFGLVYTVVIFNHFNDLFSGINVKPLITKTISPIGRPCDDVFRFIPVRYV